MQDKSCTTQVEDTWLGIEGLLTWPGYTFELLHTIHSSWLLCNLYKSIDGHIRRLLIEEWHKGVRLF